MCPNVIYVRRNSSVENRIFSKRVLTKEKTEDWWIVLVRVRYHSIVVDDSCDFGHAEEDRIHSEIEENIHPIVSEIVLNECRPCQWFNGKSILP